MLELRELDGEMMLENCERKAPLVTAVIGHGARHRQQRTAAGHGLLKKVLVALFCFIRDTGMKSWIIELVVLTLIIINDYGIGTVLCDVVLFDLCCYAHALF